MSTSDPTLICLTPIRDEAWILERFLQCTSQWADHIVIVDHCSTDGSREMARQHPKVTLLEYDEESFDEAERRGMLVDAARDLPADGRRLLFGLDADEAFTANWHESRAWQKALREAPPGTTLTFRWANVLPGAAQCWLSAPRPFGFVDDGSPFESGDIHSARLPGEGAPPSLAVGDVHVLHFQYADWPRMKSKQRWYQCWERLHHPQKRPVTLFRQYHHMDAISPEDKRPLPPAWLAGYEAEGIEMRRFSSDAPYRWDEDIVEMLEAHGPQTFRKVNIWDQDWERTRRALGRRPGGSLRDPRTPFEKAVHAWLARTQPYADSLLVRAAQKLLQPLGW